MNDFKTTTDSGIELTNKKLWALCAEYQRTILKLEEQVGREIRVRNNVIAELEAELAKYREVWLDDYVKGLETELDRFGNELLAVIAERDDMRDKWMRTLKRVASLEAKCNDLKESLRTTRLEQAAKAFQVDELETKVARLEAERNEAEEQVRTLTTERDTAKGHIKGWIEREARLSVEHMDELEQLQEQVERLTAEHEKDKQAWMSENTELLTKVERLTAQIAARAETSQPNS